MLIRLIKSISVCVQKERSSLLQELQALKEERTHLQAELDKYRECDPEVIEEMSEYRCNMTVFLKKSVLSFSINQVTQDH